MISATEALNQLWQQASAEMYQKAGAAGQQPSGSNGSSKTDTGKTGDAVDAEFEEVK